MLVMPRRRIWSVFAKKRGLTRRNGPPVHAERVNNVFAADARNRLRFCRGCGRDYDPFAVA